MIYRGLKASIWRLKGGFLPSQITKSELQLYKNYQVKYELEKLITTNQSEEYGS